VNGSLPTMVRVHLRTAWLTVAIWVVALSGTMAFTVSAIQSLYNTPAKVYSYAAAVQGNALTMINGRIAGIDSLGGIIANEFGVHRLLRDPFHGRRPDRQNDQEGRGDRPARASTRRTHQPRESAAGRGYGDHRRRSPCHRRAVRQPRRRRGSYR
jgi:hypothetical protein